MAKYKKIMSASGGEYKEIEKEGYFDASMLESKADKSVTDTIISQLPLKASKSDLDALEAKVNGMGEDVSISASDWNVELGLLTLTLTDGSTISQEIRNAEHTPDGRYLFQGNSISLMGGKVNDEPNLNLKGHFLEFLNFIKIKPVGSDKEVQLSDAYQGVIFINNMSGFSLATDNVDDQNSIFFDLIIKNDMGKVIGIIPPKQIAQAGKSSTGNDWFFLEDAEALAEMNAVKKSIEEIQTVETPISVNSLSPYDVVTGWPTGEEFDTFQSPEEHRHLITVTEEEHIGLGSISFEAKKADGTWGLVDFPFSEDRVWKNNGFYLSDILATWDGQGTSGKGLKGLVVKRDDNQLQIVALDDKNGYLNIRNIMIDGIFIDSENTTLYNAINKKT